MLDHPINKSPQNQISAGKISCSISGLNLRSWREPAALDAAFFDVPVAPQAHTQSAPFQNSAHQNMQNDHVQTKTFASPIAPQFDETAQPFVVNQPHQAKAHQNPAQQSLQNHHFNSSPQQNQPHQNPQFHEQVAPPHQSRPSSNPQPQQDDRMLNALGKILSGDFNMTSVLDLLDKSGQGLGALGKLLPLLQPLMQNNPQGGGLLSNLFGGASKNANAETINLQNYKRIN